MGAALTVSHWCDTVADIRQQVCAVLVDRGVQEDEVLQGDAVLDGEHVAVVARHYVVPLSALSIRLVGRVGGDGCRRVGGAGRKRGNDGRCRVHLTGPRHAERGSVHLLEVVAAGIDYRIPCFQLRDRDVCREGDPLAGVAGFDGDDLALVHQAQVAAGREVGAISRQVVVREQPARPNALRL